MLGVQFISVESDSKRQLSEYSISVKKDQSEDDSRLSMHGNLHLVYCKLKPLLQTMTDELCGRLVTDGMHGH